MTYKVYRDTGGGRFVLSYTQDNIYELQVSNFGATNIQATPSDLGDYDIETTISFTNVSVNPGGATSSRFRYDALPATNTINVQRTSGNVILDSFYPTQNILLAMFNSYLRLES